MARFSEARAEWELSLLPGERVELTLDARRGLLTAPGIETNSLTVTTHRVIKHGIQPGRHTTSLVPLERVAAVEISDVARSPERLTQGLVVLGVGIVLGAVAWVIFAVTLISLLVGGIPVLVGVYILAGYAFPESDGELVLHAAGYSLHQSLLTKDARRDAYLVAHRISELASATALPQAVAPPTPAEPSAPAAPEERAPVPLPAYFGPFGGPSSAAATPESGPFESEPRATGTAQSPEEEAEVTEPQAPPDASVHAPSDASEQRSPEQQSGDGGEEAKPPDPWQNWPAASSNS